MARKSFFDKRANSRQESTTTDATQARDDTRKKGDLDGDGDVDWIDKLLEVVTFIQTPKGQAMVIIAAAVFSAAINMSTYTKSVGLFLELVKAQWLIPFAWIVAFLTWALIQVFETLPRTGFWDFDTKIAILKTLNGLHIPIVSDTKNKQSDILYWQDVTVNDAKIRRQLFWVVSIGAHVLDVLMLWTDFPLGSLSPFTINWANVSICRLHDFQL
jgi:hypothetical protein